MRSFSKKLAFVLAAAMVVTTFAPAASAEAAKEMAINKSSKILYVTDGSGINDAAQVGGGKGNVSSYDFSVKNKPADWKTTLSFKWTSSNEDVATVENGGLVTAVSAGKATISCKITDKATGEVVTTAKTKVTVKKNAAEVVISNADDYDGTVVEVNGVVDLNRTMYDVDGTKTTKRGTVVTDYTKWVAEPAAGVEIDQKSGKFTFTEAAEAGEYKLYCYTYQSSKYEDATATSDPVMVVFQKAQTFEIKQDTAKKITVSFSKKVDALNVADVTVNKMISDYAYAETIKAVTVAEDGMSAVVELFGEFADAANYTVKVKNFEDNSFVASVGTPVRMAVVAKDKTPANIITTGVTTDLVCKFYDAAGVDVTDKVAANMVTYKLETPASTGEYYLASNKLTIKKNTASVTVIANYRGKFENGKIVGALEAKETFYAVDAAAVIPASVSGYNLDGNWNDGVTHSMQVKEVKKLELKLNHSDNQNADKIYVNGDSFNGSTKEKITVTAATPEIAVVAGQNIKPYKAGVAVFYVNYATLQNNKWVEMPFAVIEIEVLDNAVVSSIKFDNESLFVGTADYYLLADEVTRTTDHTLAKEEYALDVNKNKKQAGFSLVATQLIAYDQRGARTDFIIPEGKGAQDVITVKCLSDGFGNGYDATKVAELWNVYTPYTGTYWDGSNCNYIGIKMNAVAIRDYFASLKLFTPEDNGEYVTLDYEVVYKNANGTSMSAYFTITVQEPTGNVADNYIEIAASSNYIDITRKNDDNNKDAKTVKFEVFEKNNGVIVDTFEVGAYDESVATAGAYQYVLYKDGRPIAESGAKVDPGMSGDHPDDRYEYTQCTEVMNNNKVTITLSGIKNDGNYNVPDYSKGGAGTYTYVLGKWENVEGAGLVFVEQQRTDVTAVVGSAGEYTIDHNAQRSNKVTVINDENILKCFTIKNTKGADVVKTENGAVKVDLPATTLYKVNYTNETAADYIYVKDIVFYEKIAEGVYLPFTVAVDVVLEK